MMVALNRIEQKMRSMHSMVAYVLMAVVLSLGALQPSQAADGLRCQDAFVSVPVSGAPVSTEQTEQPSSFRSLFKTASVALGSKLKDFALSIRYEVTVEGLDEIMAKGQRGVLIVMKHPGYTDPPIATSVLRWFKPRPVIDEKQQTIPVVGKILEIAGNEAHAIWMPNLKERKKAAKSPAEIEAALAEVQAAMNQAIEYLKQGHTVLLYPAGRLMTSHQEEIGHKKMMHHIVSALPNVPIVMGRMSGHWGSAFGHGQTGKLNAVRAAGIGVFTVLTNVVHFVPKRKIKLEFIEPDDFPRHGTRDEMNQYVSDWFNELPEPNIRVPYHALDPRGTRVLPQVKSRAVPGMEKVVLSGDDETFLLGAIAELAALAGTKISEPATLKNNTRLLDLGLSEMAKFQLILAIENRFIISLPEETQLETVGDVFRVTNNTVLEYNRSVLGR